MKTKHFFPESGVAGSDLIKRIEGLKSGDARWELGKVFGFVYHPGSHLAKLSGEYLNAFLYESTLNPSAFPSLRKFEKDIVRMTTELMHGDQLVAGSVTTGGSESIFLALKVACEHANDRHTENTRREIVIPETAHPAFLKACHYLGLKAVIVPVGNDKRADMATMQRAITSSTIMMACSAPCFPLWCCLILSGILPGSHASTTFFFMWMPAWEDLCCLSWRMLDTRYLHLTSELRE